MGLIGVLILVLLKALVFPGVPDLPSAIYTFLVFPGLLGILVLYGSPDIPRESGYIVILLAEAASQYSYAKITGVNLLNDPATGAVGIAIVAWQVGVLFAVDKVKGKMV